MDSIGPFRLRHSTVVLWDIVFFLFFKIFNLSFFWYLFICLFCLLTPCPLMNHENIKVNFITV